MRIQHETRKAPFDSISILGKVYSVDAEGCLEVPDAAAKVLLQGNAWRTPAHWDKHPSPLALGMPPAKAGGIGRRPRTREEMGIPSNTATPPAAKPQVEEPVTSPATPAALAKAADPGPVTPPAEEPALDDVEGHDASAPDEETIEVSEAMSREELMKIAQQQGVSVPKKATKLEIIELLEKDSAE